MSGRPGSVRIVAGARRGQKVRVAPGSKVRPTGQKVREAIFSVLGPVNGLVVLDLFAGTGAMGLEALSRGAEQCVFVEEEPAVVEVLRGNIAALDYEQVSKVIATGYSQALRILVHMGARFDLLFVDPPYRMLAEVEVMLTPLLPLLLSTEGVTVIEGGRSSAVTLGEVPVFDRTYGDTKVTMIRMRRSIQ